MHAVTTPHACIIRVQYKRTHNYYVTTVTSVLIYRPLHNYTHFNTGRGMVIVQSVIKVEKRNWTLPPFMNSTVTSKDDSEMLAPFFHLINTSVHVHDLQQITIIIGNSGLRSWQGPLWHHAEGGSVQLEDVLLGRQHRGAWYQSGQEQNTQTMKYSTSHCERWMAWVKPLW